MSFNLLFLVYQIAGENSEREEELLALGMPFLCTHAIGGVGWELPPRGPHWDLLTTKVEQLQFLVFHLQRLFQFCLSLPHTCKHSK